MPVGRLWHCDDAPLSRDCRFPVVSFRAEREIFCLQTIDFSVAWPSRSFEAGLLRNDRVGDGTSYSICPVERRPPAAIEVTEGGPVPLMAGSPPHVISSAARNLGRRMSPCVIGSAAKQSQFVWAHSPQTQAQKKKTWSLLQVFCCHVVVAGVRNSPPWMPTGP